MTELVVKENGIAQVTQQAIEAINQVIAEEKAVKEKKEAMQQALLEQMEKYNVTQIKNDYFTVSYTAEHTADRFDSKALKEQSPALYESYCKETKVKASLRITPKKVSA